VEYFSIKGDERCQLYLKGLQDIMGNEMMQVLLESEDDLDNSQKHSKEQYQTIADLV
jgi:hypothetical protein